MPPSMPSCYTYRAAILAVTCAPRGRVSADDTGYGLMSRSGDRSCTSSGETARPWVVVGGLGTNAADITGYGAIGRPGWPSREGCTHTREPHEVSHEAVLLSCKSGTGIS